MHSPLTPQSIVIEEDKVVLSRSLKKLFSIVFLSFFVCGMLFYFIFNSLVLTPTVNFPVNTAITIPPGSSAKEVTKLMKNAGFVNSEFALYLSLLWWHDPSQIKASTYIFSKPFSAKDLATELTTGHFDNDLTKLTFIEGERAEIIAKRAKDKLPSFNEAEFLALAIPVEGTLFPETYFVPDTYTAQDLFTLLTTTYKEKVASLQIQFASSSLSEKDILTLASIVEREANTEESMKIVSGILQKRLSMNMPLQVDASLEYDLDKSLAELTAADLEIDSPYNTYKNTGLPPTPIGNPGLKAIKAVLEPVPTAYLFYITGDDGEFRYAKTFAEHKENIARYLR